MKKTKLFATSLIVFIGLVLAGCGLSGDLEDMKIIETPSFESNGGGGEGGTGGENLPPPAD